MASILDSFPSNYIKANDLRGKDVPVTMDRVEHEDIGGEVKPVLYFLNKDRGLVLNKTNATCIAEQHGADYTTWGGKGITLFPSQTDFQGKTVPCVRVRLGNSPAGSVVESMAPAAAADDDDIPF